MAGRKPVAAAQPKEAVSPSADRYMPIEVAMQAIQTAGRASEHQLRQTETELMGMSHHTNVLANSLNGTIAALAGQITTQQGQIQNLLAEIAKRDAEIGAHAKQSAEFTERMQVRVLEAEKASNEAAAARQNVKDILGIVMPVVEGGKQLAVMMMAAKLGIPIPMGPMPGAAQGGAPAGAGGLPAAANSQTAPSVAHIEDWTQAVVNVLAACSAETRALLRSAFHGLFLSQDVAGTMQPLLQRIAAEAGDERMNLLWTFTVAAQQQAAASQQQNPPTTAASAA